MDSPKMSRATWLREKPDSGERAALPDNPISLSQAIRAGTSTFEEAGGASAYFGYPAAATVAEGHKTIDALGDILAEAVERDAS